MAQVSSAQCLSCLAGASTLARARCSPRHAMVSEAKPNRAVTLGAWVLISALLRGSQQVPWPNSKSRDRRVFSRNRNGTWPRAQYRRGGELNSVVYSSTSAAAGLRLFPDV